MLEANMPPLKSKMIIQDIVLKNFDGTSSAHYDPIVGTLVCSSAEVGFQK